MSKIVHARWAVYDIAYIKAYVSTDNPGAAYELGRRLAKHLGRREIDAYNGCQRGAGRRPAIFVRIGAL
jgi:hypothetical protein